MSRSARKNHVIAVLKDYPQKLEDGVLVTDIPHNELVVRVWQRELGDKPFTPENVMKLSSAEGVIRDRRRIDVLELFPRSEGNFEKYRGYRDEFGNPTIFSKFFSKEKA